MKRLAWIVNGGAMLIAAALVGCGKDADADAAAGGASGSAGSGGGGATAGGGAGSGGSAGAEPGAGGGSGAAAGQGSGGDSGSAGAAANGGSAGSGGAGPASCGDGRLAAGEACDDGNLASGDGCSAGCAIEPGFECSALPCRMVDGRCAFPLPAVYRDFGADHGDFEPAGDLQAATQGLLAEELDAEGKPVYVGTSGLMSSSESFAEWYRDVPSVNATTHGELVLWDNGAGQLVNRWGDSGEPWIGYPYFEDEAGARVMYCDGVSCDAAACMERAANETCLRPCWPLAAGDFACIATFREYDGDPVFFPIDDSPNVVDDVRSAATIAPAYGLNHQAEPPQPPATTAPLHNFHFTTELRFRFRYDPGVQQMLEVVGDDDIWLFLNGRLAIDLGGWQPPLGDRLTLSAELATSYGLEAGGVYEVALFHADRKRSGSSLRLVLTGFDLGRSVCSPQAP